MNQRTVADLIIFDFDGAVADSEILSNDMLAVELSLAGKIASASRPA